MSRPIKVPRWAVYVLLFGLYLTVRGYQSRDGDQAYRLPLLLHQQNPALFAHDHFVRAFDAFNPHRGYLALLDAASRPLGLSFGLFALYALTFALTCYGISRLARALWPERGPSVGLVAVALVLLARAGNIGTNHLFEPMLLDRLIGFALGWVALALAIEGRIWQPSVLIGLATIVHSSVGLQLGALLVACWIAWWIGSRWTGQSLRGAGLGILTVCLALMPGAALTLMQGNRLFAGLTPAEFRLLGVELQMAQHMVPSLWRMPQWLAWGAYMVLGSFSLLVREGGTARGPRDPSIKARFAILFGVLLAGLGVAYLMVEVVGNLRVTVLQPFRMATVARGLALIAVSGRCVLLWTRDGYLGKTRALLIAAGLAGDWAFVVAVAVEIAASLAECLPASWKKWAGIGVLGGFVYGISFLSRHDTEQGHRWLLAALALSAFHALGTSRFRAGWTRRRHVFATLACWLVPLAALLVPLIIGLDNRLAVALAARCRFAESPMDEVERLAVWARANTPPGSTFITPPGPKTFRLWSERAVAFNRAASPYHALGLSDWSQRFRAHVGFEGTTADFVHAYLADRHGFESRYARLTPEGLAALARSQGAKYILASAPLNGKSTGPLRMLRVDGRYAIYQVDTSPRDEAVVKTGAEESIRGRN
jgi:hypothetical protein